MDNFGVEYSHIYTDQSFGNGQIESIKRLKKTEEKLKRQGFSVSRLILIDDYSSPVSFDRFNFDSFLKELQRFNALPDVIVRESDIIKCCMATLNLINDKKTKHQLRNYIDSKGKFPCSLFIAAWYLLRLDAFGHIKVNCVYGDSNKIFSDKVITILPDSFRTPENNASEIIGATKFRNLIKRIERIFFYYLKPQYSGWDEFDPYEYVERNYGKTILREDKRIIELVIKRLQKLGVVQKSFQFIADVGVGPNLYPSMLLSPFVSDKGAIELLDVSKPNLTYLKNVLSGSKEKNNWIKFEKFMCKKGGLMYRNCLKKTVELAQVRVKKLETLPKEKYEVVMCFFTAEGICDEIEKFRTVIKKLISSVKKGGLIITGHMIGSRGYYAGERTSFPSVNLTVSDLEQEFSGLKNLTIDLVRHDNQKSVRLGYRGMVLVIGKINQPDRLLRPIQQLIYPIR